VTTGAGDDLISGHQGADELRSGDSDDTVFGGQGADTILAENGDDWVSGLQGDDFIKGSAGNDTLFGDVGSDWLEGGSGDDVVNGGNGNDTVLHLRNSTGVDIAVGGKGFDTLIIDLTTTQWADQRIKADVASLLAHLDAGRQDAISLARLGLTASEFEALLVQVGGEPIELTGLGADPLWG
jgi:Ca2+-binding RTX toxin-like protein